MRQDAADEGKQAIETDKNSYAISADAESVCGTQRRVCRWGAAKAIQRFVHYL